MAKGDRTGKIIEGYWACPFCGQNKILGRYRECPGCGRPRGLETDFEVKEKNYVDNPSKIFLNPDWLCSYCDSLNPDNVDTCIGCGASREDSKENYFSMKKKRENTIEKKEVQPKEDYMEPIVEEYKENINDKKDVPNYRKENYPLNNTNDNKNFSDTYMNINWASILKIFGGVIGIIALIFGLIWLFTPKKDTLTVEQVNWNYSVTIQEKKTFSESDWSVPTGARVYDERQEVHHQDRVIDHYETVEVEKYEDVIVGYESDYEDLGNGYFAEVEGDPIYERHTWTETEEEPVYKYVDVYQTKYYYYIDRWVYKRSVDTSGTDKNPYFGEITLGYNERKNGTTTSYSIDVINSNGEAKTYSISEENWRKIDKGDTLDVEISKLGTLTNIINIQKD